MAIIKLGTLIVGIRGTTGGLTYSANKSGPYVKPWQQPPRSRSVLQTTKGNILPTVAAYWRTMAQSDRDDWDTWAAGSAPARFNSLGEPKDLSGFNWFCEMNSRLVLFNQAIVDAAPTLAEPTAPTITSWAVVTTPATDATVTFPAGTFTSWYKYFRIGMAIGEAANSFSRPLFYVRWRPPAADTNNQLTGDIQVTWGTIQENRTWFLQMARVNADGLIGPFSQARTFTNE